MPRGTISAVLTFTIRFEFPFELSSLSLYIYIYIERVIFICKPLKEYKLVNLIIAVDQNNQGMIWIHRKYENMKYMEN